MYFVDERVESDYLDDAVIINGITSIQPGESVIVVNDENTANFTDVWGSVYNITDIQIGTHDGKGLGGKGDIVNLFISNTTPTDNTTRVDSEAYPDTELNPGQSYDVTKGGFSVLGDAPYFPAATAVNDGNESAIGSPGNKGESLSTDDININRANIFPIPFDNELQIQLNTQRNTTSTVKILDMIGSVVYNKEVVFSNGQATLNNTYTLPSGVYVLHIADLNITLKIIKE